MNTFLQAVLNYSDIFSFIGNLEEPVTTLLYLFVKTFIYVYFCVLCVRFVIHLLDINVWREVHSVDIQRV